MFSFFSNLGTAFFLFAPFSKPKNDKKTLQDFTLFQALSLACFITSAVRKKHKSFSKSKRWFESLLIIEPTVFLADFEWFWYWNTAFSLRDRMHQVVDVVWHGWIMLDSFLRPETTTFIWVPAESEHRRGVGRKHFEPGWGPQSHRRIMAGSQSWHRLHFWSATPLTFFCALSWLAFPKSRMSFSSVTVLTVLRLGMVHPSLCLALVHSTSFTTCNILPESHLASWRWLSDCASQGARDTSKPSTWGPLVIFSTFPGARPNLRRGQSPPKDGSLRVYACLHYLWQSPKTIGDHRNVNYRELLVAKHHVFADCKGWTLTGAVHSSSVSSDLTASTSMYQLMRQRSPYFDWNQQSQFYACNNYINLAFVLGWSWMCTCALVHLPAGS